jgi:hypothetical protein
MKHNYKKLNLLIMMLVVGEQGYAMNYDKYDYADNSRDREQSYYSNRSSNDRRSQAPADATGNRHGQYSPYSVDAFENSFDNIAHATNVLYQDNNSEDVYQPARTAAGTKKSYQTSNPKSYNSKPDYDAIPLKNQHPFVMQPQSIMMRATLSDTDRQADKLIELSYFSPEMQQAVLACVGKSFKVNVVTGKVQNIPTVAQIIASQPVENTTKLNALYASLEATRIALFLAGLNVAYDNPKYVFFAPNISSNLFMPAIDPELKKALNDREADILAALQENPDYLHWYNVSSWIPEDVVSMFTVTNKKLQADVTQLLNSTLNPLEFNPDINNLEAQSNFVTISGNTLKELMKHFNYKQKVNPQQAANLLFKQCFIAQQIFDNDSMQQFFPADSK